MEINVKRIKDGESVELTHTYDPKELGLEKYDVRYAEPLSFTATAERIRATLSIRGNLKTILQIGCMRCLKPVDQAANEPFEFYHTLKQEEVLDITDQVRESMILSYPVKFLCSEECKGLCSHCGQNLNEGVCGCREEMPQTSSAFEKLADWHKKKKPTQQ